MITPLLAGDFTFYSFYILHMVTENLYKCYTNLWENIFQYLLPRARMVTEDAYGQLKGRWRILLRKCESKKETMKLHTHACVCLHNLCIELSDSLLINRDLWDRDEMVTVEPRKKSKKFWLWLIVFEQEISEKKQNRYLKFRKYVLGWKKVPEISSEQNENFLTIFKWKNTTKKLIIKRYYSTVFIFIVHICSSKLAVNKSILKANNRNIKKCAKYVQY